MVTARIAWPRRGRGPDEAASFLRAVDKHVAMVDRAGYVTMPTVMPKHPVGRYALFSRIGDGISINLEYLIQIGATAELVLDHGWPSSCIAFERGEFDALAIDPGGRVLVAMEAKARATGPDSLEKLLNAWLTSLGTGRPAPPTNAGRKFDELARLTEHGPILVWLVAEGARWSMWAYRHESDMLVLGPAVGPDRAIVTAGPPKEAAVYDTQPYDSSLHRPGTAAAGGAYSWHGPVSCSETPVISFQDAQGRWQSGCQRAVDELTVRGDITDSTSRQE